jgi:hypothetical protein
MSFSGAVIWSVNLLRSTQVRAQSRHTTNWGLARLSNHSEPIHGLVAENLSQRIVAGNISMEQLYGFSPSVVGMAIAQTDPKNTVAVARLLSSAKEGEFMMPVRLEGKQMKEQAVVDEEKIKGFEVVQTGVYAVEAMLPYKGYNLSFFKALKDSVADYDWGTLEETIANLPAEEVQKENVEAIAWTIRFVDLLFLSAQNKLKVTHPLPDHIIDLPHSQRHL